jgi:hypothetical protein
MTYKTRCIPSYTYSYWNTQRILMLIFHVDFVEIIHNLNFCTWILEWKLAFFLERGGRVGDITHSRGCYISQQPTSYARFVRPCAINSERTNHTWRSIISSRWPGHSKRINLYKRFYSMFFIIWRGNYLLKCCGCNELKSLLAVTLFWANVSHRN